MIRVALIIIFEMMLGFCALACDNPGTPNPVSAFAINSSTIQLKITNTATEGNEHKIWFLAQDAAGNVQRFSQGRILDGDFAVFNEHNLQANSQYCFRIWTRVDTISGCESKQPSGYVCATTKPPYSPQLQVSNNAQEDPSSTMPTPTTTSNGPTLISKDGQECCNNPVGSFDKQCCDPNSLICPNTMHWYCAKFN